MLPHDRVPIWLNLRRRRELERLRALLVQYFGSVTHEAFPFRVIESPDSAALRSEIEPELSHCIEVVRATARVPLIRLVPAERTGRVMQVNLLSVVFELDRHSLDTAQVFEVLDAALEIYRADTSRAAVRTLNPLYWVDMTLALFEVLPFMVLRRFGVDSGRAARSGAGVALRVVVRLAVLAGLVLFVLTAVGLRGEAGSVARDLLDLVTGWMPSA